MSATKHYLLTEYTYVRDRKRYRCKIKIHRGKLILITKDEFRIVTLAEMKKLKGHLQSAKQLGEISDTIYIEHRDIYRTKEGTFMYLQEYLDYAYPKKQVN